MPLHQASVLDGIPGYVIDGKGLMFATVLHGVLITLSCDCPSQQLWYNGS